MYATETYYCCSSYDYILLGTHRLCVYVYGARAARYIRRNGLQFVGVLNTPRVKIYRHVCTLPFPPLLSSPRPPHACIYVYICIIFLFFVLNSCIYIYAHTIVDYVIIFYITPLSPPPPPRGVYIVKKKTRNRFFLRCILYATRAYIIIRHEYTMCSENRYFFITFVLLERHIYCIQCMIRCFDRAGELIKNGRVLDY